MSIQALPSTTVRQIGASQAVTDPASVVKELLDNALDAHATAVYIEISANTLDTILVRDNGHGVAPEDRGMICRRYCTSKIREFSDLEFIGGKSLGFRGEALTSIAEISETFTLTTRVESEDVAAALKIIRTGEVQSRDHASHPVGTSVRLANLFENIPVRKQTALKNAAKCIAKVTNIVHSYAFARPTVRFSLKVLKAKTDKGNWIYSPKPTGNAEDAAFKIVGKECASQCTWSVISHEGFEVQALLPASHANPLKICNTGHFLSIDARPVSCAKGTLKQIITKIKERQRTTFGSSDSIKDPFIFLNILCPPNSYDPNVEPAKDDVLFENSDVVLAAVQKLLNSVYIEETRLDTPSHLRYSTELHVSSPSRVQDRPRSLDEDIEIHVSEEPHASSDGNEFESRPSKRRRTMMPIFEIFDATDPDSSDPNGRPADNHNMDDNEEDVGVRSAGISVSNPWTIAKMNTSLSSTPARVRQQCPPVPLLQELNQFKINSVLTSSHEQNFPSHSPWTLPTPRSTSPFDEYASPRQRSGACTSVSSENELQSEGRRSHQYLEEANYKPSMPLSLEAPGEPQPGYSSPCRPPAFVSANELPLGTPWSNGMEQAPKPQGKSQHHSSKPRNSYNWKKQINKPFVPPMRTFNSHADHLYLLSSPPSMASPPGFTPTNASEPHTNQNNSVNQSSSDIRSFLRRLQDVGSSPRQGPLKARVEDGSENGSSESIEVSEMDCEAAFPTSLIRAKLYKSKADLPVRTPRATIDPPELFQPPIVPPADAASRQNVTSSELRDLIVTLRISLDVLASISAKFERLSLSCHLFDTNMAGTFPLSPPTHDDPPSTFLEHPPEPPEMEDWRQQLIHFVQSENERRNGDVDVNIDVEGAVDALIEEYGDVSRREEQEQELYDSEETEMLLT